MMRDRLTYEVIEDERYELLENGVYRFAASRREFVRILGAGLLVSFTPRTLLAQRRPSRGSRETPLSERLHIGADGVITVMTGKVEVGQGSRTQITQAAAEELRVPIDRVRLVMGDTTLCPDDGGTSGSRTTPSTIPAVRRAAAATREMLIDLAATHLKVDRSSLRLRDGEITDPASGKSVTYGELTRKDGFDTALERSGNRDASITRVEEWTVLGTPVARVGGVDVVTGVHRYPSDIVRPGMLYGKVLRPASYGAKLTSIDLAPAEAMEGVTVVRDGEFIGCAAKTSFLAQRAIDAIAGHATWDSPPHPSSDELFTYLKEHAQSGGGDGRSSRGGQPRGSVKDALASAKSKLKAAYQVAYIQHAPMEPRAAVAEWSEGSLTVWTGTQNPTRVKQELAETFRLRDDRVRVIVPDTGGGFGGKHTGEVAVEAARLAKSAGHPVCVRWTREEEFSSAYFRPAGLIEIEAGLDAAGLLTAWDFANYNSGSSAIETPYDVPNVATRFIRCESPLREGSYRALASTANAFARECFMDELAAEAGVDPLEFRLRHLPEGRLRDALLVAAQRFDWQGRKDRAAANRGFGLACGTEKASYVAACAQVEVDRRTGTIKVAKVCQAFECGAVQNPANLRDQVAGCIIMGLGGALFEAIQFRHGRILNNRFSKYRVPRMEDLPELDIVLHDRPDLEFVGAGETPIIAVAPAVANAVFDATGVRLRSMPLDGSVLKQA